MDIIAKRNSLGGTIQVPGSKSHTIRALLLACLAEGESKIKNPLPSADCYSTANAVPLLGSQIDFGSGSSCAETVWSVNGAGKNIHCPQKVDVGNSGSLLYFLSAICATLKGETVFDGDASIRKRPVNHVVEALSQLGAKCFTEDELNKFCPLHVNGIDCGCADESNGDAHKKNYSVTTAGEISSQYITGIMLAATRLNGTTQINLTNPKETPYLTMTQKWLEKVNVKTDISPDYKKITVEGPVDIQSFETTIPSDWEAVAFPLVAALLTDSEITITDIDGSGTQGDDAIVEVLKSLGADIEWNRESKTITVRGGKKARNGNGRLSTENLPGNELHVNLSGYPDALCAMAVAACFTEGTVYFEDLSVCRRKETDRIAVMKKELSKTGACVEEGEDFLIVRGHSPVNRDGSANSQFNLHGAKIESYDDHRVAMSFACMGLGLPSGEEIQIKKAECCSVSFPHFYEKMNLLGADFTER